MYDTINPPGAIRRVHTKTYRDNTKLITNGKGTDLIRRFDGFIQQFNKVGFHLFVNVAIPVKRR